MDATKTKAPNSFTRSHGRGATMACTSIDVATAGGQKCWDHGGGFVGLCIFGGGTEVSLHRFGGWYGSPNTFLGEVLVAPRHFGGSL